MSHPLRIEHIHIGVIAHAMDRFDAQVLAYCQMGNYFHLVLHTREANLSRLMRHVNGVYTQAFNRRHGLVGHTCSRAASKRSSDPDPGSLVRVRSRLPPGQAAKLEGEAADDTPQIYT